MKLLKMYRFPGELEEPRLPEGYSYSVLKSDDEKHDWAKCLRGGNLITGRDDEQAYYDEILRLKDDIVPTQDVHFLDYNGEHVGTVTAFVYAGTKEGRVHQVGIRSDFRGRGLGKYLAYIALKSLFDRGVDFVSLVTDESRMPAVKTYLAAGFKPVEYEYGMLERWIKVLRAFDIESVDMYYEDASFYRTVYAYKKDAKVRFGVLGGGRGVSLADFCRDSDLAEVVALCDCDEKVLQKAKDTLGEGLAYYTDFDEFLKCDMDCVVLANYANMHAPFAVKALDKGLNVLSELLPVQNMKEAVELVEAVERSSGRYFYAENCCFMPGPKKMAQLFKDGNMGQFRYGEGEYLHNCENDWQYHSHCDRNHWRNTMSAFFYCTHSIGPLIRISGLRPVSVVGFEAPYDDKMRRMGALGAPFAMEIITLENGAFIKSLHGVGPSKNSLWFSVYGDRGEIETARDTAYGGDGTQVIYMKADETIGSDDNLYSDVNCDDGLTAQAENSTHGGADYYLMYNVCQAIKGNKNADVIDVYEALDMFLPGMFGFFSALDGSKPQAIPNLRNKEERETWRFDTRCQDKEAAGDMFIPSCVGGNAEIPDETYEKLREKLK